MRCLASLLALAVLGAAPLLGQRAPERGPGRALVRGMELERAGWWVEAAEAYRQALQEEPAQPAALLGIERAYGQLGWSDSVLAVTARAIAAESASAIAHTIELRTLQKLGRDSLLARSAERWVRAAPTSEEPYREWARALLAAGDFALARRVIEAGRAALRAPGRFAPEMAGIEIAAGRWVMAAREWRAAVEAEEVYLSPASFRLQAAPRRDRDEIVRVLTEPGAPAPARRLAADLLVGWGDPETGWALLRSALPDTAAGAARVAALRRFAERAQLSESPSGPLLAALALALVAAATPPAEAAQARVEAARAFASAGRGEEARRVLARLVEDPMSPAPAAEQASVALVELYAARGDPAAAARTLERERERLGAGEAFRLARAVAMAWIAAGELARAEALVGADSSLAAEEVRGWIALYRGDLGQARSRLRAAGARGGEDGDAGERVAVLALLQAVDRDTMPELGSALLLAARGEPLRASRALVSAARGLRGGEGEPEVLLWAATYLSAAAGPERAETLWVEIAERFPNAVAAPVAELALARALLARGQSARAVERLEHLILAHPSSALVPEARRELERARGVLP
jgi:tetratricopeptide (TPR) repeat protein